MRFTHMAMSQANNFLPDHGGEDYRSILSRLHRELNPKNYFEIGTRHGNTLELATCKSIAIDPDFQFHDPKIFSDRPASLLFQMTSDNFFSKYDPTAIFSENIQFAFLDGMHRSEFLLRDFYNTETFSSPNTVIAIHDCLPVELPMTSRNQGGITPIKETRGGWWTGDVWRAALLLKRERPDLDILALNAPPTGLILITNLNPKSTFLRDEYNQLAKKMLSYDLSEIGLSNYFTEMQVADTDIIGSPEKITARYWL